MVEQESILENIINYDILFEEVHKKKTTKRTGEMVVLLLRGFVSNNKDLP